MDAHEFWARLQVTDAGCWEWTGGQYIQGYGRVYVDRRPYRAHRLAYTLAKGVIPDGISVCHSCDNRLCCNPAHLWLGSQADNLKDMAQKGRQISKLTADDVRAIRQERIEQKTSLRALAKRYGVNARQIERILRGEAWKHI